MSLLTQGTSKNRINLLKPPIFKIILISILAIVLILAVGYLIKTLFTSKASQPVPPPSRTITVTATNNRFSPSVIESTLFEDIDISVTAVDQNYEFKVDDYPRLDATIKKGKTLQIPIRYLGVGEYRYICGLNCQGTIVIQPQVDDPGEYD